jgi:ABC-2 type transport system permease protein
VRFIWNTAQKDLRRYWRDPMALVLYLGIPLLIGGLLTLVMGGSGGTPPTGLLYIADEDGGLLSRLLVQGFSQDRVGQFIRVERVTREEGRKEIGNGKGSALLVIPEGFSTAVLQEQPTRLLLVVNPSQQIMPQILEEGLEILSEGTFYSHRVLGDEIRQMVQGPPGGARVYSDADVARISTSINEVIRRIGQYLFPPVISLETSVDASQSGEKINMAVIMLPGIIVMALMFMVQGLGEDLWRERAQGTLRRAATTPRSITVHLAGKVVAGTIVVGTCTLIILLAGMVYVGVPLARLPLALGWSVVSGAILLLLMMPIQLFASTQRAASVMSACLVMPLLFVGGNLFPLEVMPDWMAAIGRWTPNGWVCGQLKDILLDRWSVATLGMSVLVLAVVGVALFLLSERRLRVFARS